jgi:hypothetical protein
MLYREIIAVCSEIHTKHTNTLCGQNVELLNVKTGRTYSNHWAVTSINSVNRRRELHPWLSSSRIRIQFAALHFTNLWPLSTITRRLGSLGDLLNLQ